MARPSQWLAEGHTSTFAGTVGYVVHDRPKCAPFYSIWSLRVTSPLLLDLSADILTHETSDERNDLITFILPYVVMAFKVSQFLAL